MQILQDTNTLLQEMTATEQRKFDAAVKNRIFEIEDCMKAEQAMVMRLRGLDKKREKLQEKLGFTDKTFREIIAMQSEETKAPLEQLFLQMQNNLDQYKQVSQSASDALSLNLHRIDQNLERLRGRKESNIYAENGAIKKERHSFTNRKA